MSTGTHTEGGKALSGKGSVADTGTQEASGTPPIVDRLHDAKLADSIRKGNKKMSELRDERKAINQDMTATISELEAQGLSRLAIKHAMKIAELSPEERNIYDLSMFILRRTEKCAPQIDMFMSQDKAGKH